jgi:NitT/TauT family transport system ATP-binding protein
LLRVKDLALSYGATPVLEGVSLDVPSGKFVSLVGPSGSGKSSLLRAVIGLQKPSAGTVTGDFSPGEIGFLFQDDALLPWRSAEENVALGLRLKGVDKGSALATARQWLTRLGLYGLSERWPRQLSGGQRKRVALAQVLAREPRLLLMDEPFASLDAIVRARVTADLVRLVEQRGISVLLVTHDLEEALALSDTVYLMSLGPRAQISGRYDVTLPRPRDPMTARAHPDFAPLLARLWADLSREVGGRAA